MDSELNKFTDDRPRVMGLYIKPAFFSFVIGLLLLAASIMIGYIGLLITLVYMSIVFWYLNTIKKRPFILEEYYVYFSNDKEIRSSCFFDKENFMIKQDQEENQNL